jgi:hypothetical protein
MEKKERKKRKNLSIDELIELSKKELEIEEYYKYESKRVKSLWKITAIEWIAMLKAQKLKCYYCGTEISIIQRLILNKIIKPRKRGTDSYSGLHFELDHKNANKKDNSKNNLVASCYYCNNDKSNTISSDIFKKYFCLRKTAFINLISDYNIIDNGKLHHHLSGKK